MKLLKLSLMFVLVSLFAACGNDDSGDCLQDDWVGTYTGTVICNGTAEDADITITANGLERIRIRYETPTFIVTYDPSEHNGCDLDISSEWNGSTIKLEGSIDGNTLSLIETVSSSTGIEICEISGIK